MAFKLFVISTLLAYANAGFLSAPAAATYSAAADVSGAYIHHAPIAYAAPQLSVQSPAYGQTHQSVERSPGGAQSISHYSKAIDSAFSSVRKYDTRITNDALTYAKSIAPAVTYSSGPLLAKAVAPAVAYSAGPAPIAAYAAHAPVATYAAHAPVAAYAAPGPLIAKTVGGPVLAKAAVAYSPATVVAHTSFSGFGTAYEW